MSAISSALFTTNFASIRDSFMPAVFSTNRTTSWLSEWSTYLTTDRTTIKSALFTANSPTSQLPNKSAYCPTVVSAV